MVTGKGLFVVDLDGTFLGDDKRLAGVDREALAGLRDIGVVTAIATGRSNFSLQKIIKELGVRGSDRSFPVDYLIFSTGAGIMDYPAGNLLRKHSLNSEDILVISDFFYEHKLDYMIHRSVPDTKHFLYNYCTGANSDFETRLALYKEHGAVLTSENLADFGEATEVICIVEKSAGDEVVCRLSDVFSQYSVIRATSPLDKKSVWVEIFAKDVSKGKAVSWLSENIGVPQNRVCAVGNDYNDADMLDWAGQSYLVANGPASLLPHYNTVASNNEGGVAEAVFLWLKEQQL